MTTPTQQQERQVFFSFVESFPLVKQGDDSQTNGSGSITASGDGQNQTSSAGDQPDLFS
jgi:hypothetical protein